MPWLADQHGPCGCGAASWLAEAAAAGTRRIRAKMAEAVALSKLYSPAQVDRALGTAAITGRFAGKDLLPVLDYQDRQASAEPSRAGEGHSLQPGTSAWASFGATPASNDARDNDKDLT